jgi:hypothetical protein
VKALEVKIPDPARARKALLPEWLMASLVEQGIRLDFDGRLHFPPFKEESSEDGFSLSDHT